MRYSQGLWMLSLGFVATLMVNTPIRAASKRCVGWMLCCPQVALTDGPRRVRKRTCRGISDRRTHTAEAQRGRHRFGGNRQGVPSKRDVPSRVRQWPLSAGSHFGQDEDALHPDPSRRSCPGGTDAVRPSAGPDHLSLQVSGGSSRSTTVPSQHGALNAAAFCCRWAGDR